MEKKNIKYAIIFLLLWLLLWVIGRALIGS